MSGGGALLRNIDKLLTQVTGVPCHVAENALNCVALGTGLALEHFDFFKKSLVQPSDRPMADGGRRIAAAGRLRRPALPHERQLRLPVRPGHGRCARHAERGLTHLAITDHDRIDGALRARDAAPAGLTVIVGEEIRTADGDLIGALPRGGDPAGPLGRRDDRRDPRPGRPGRDPAPVRSVPGLAAATTAADGRRSRRVVDWIEVHNARLVGGGQRAGGGASPRSSGWPGVAVSDAHTIARDRRRLHGPRRRSVHARPGCSRRSPRRRARARSCELLRARGDADRQARPAAARERPRSGRRVRA